MKVAIMGAGVAGLACAFELEKYGLRPDIFEVQDAVGGRAFNHMAGWMNIMYRPIQDAIEYLKNDFGIVLKPNERITRVDFYSKNESVSMKGPKLGYIINAGPAAGTVQRQMLDHIRTPIRYGEIVNFRDLSHDYDHVVIATGTPEIPMVLGNWRTDIAGYIYGATITGEFDPQTVKMWFNTQWAQRAYGYFVPWNDRKGSLILNMQEVGSLAAQKNWQKFLNTIKWDMEIMETYETPHNIGHVFQRRHKNLIFTGVAGGFLDPLFAFGAVASIDSGASAAKAIVEGADYDKLVANWVKRNQNMRIMRRYVDKFTDDDYDLAIRILKTPLFLTLASRSTINLVSLMSKLAKVMVSHKIEQTIT